MIPPRPASDGRAPDDKTLPAPDPAQVQVIRTYGPGRFVISDREWRSPVLVTPRSTTAWNVTRAEDLSLESLAALKAAPAPAEILVLGKLSKRYMAGLYTLIRDSNDQLSSILFEFNQQLLQVAPNPKRFLTNT